MKKGIIFDMDGTLWDSAEEVVTSWNQSVKAAGYDRAAITASDMQSVMGKTMDKLADILFPMFSEEERYALLDRCGKDENEYLRQHGGRLYPDIRTTMETLKKKYHLYIVSNCQSGYIEAFLDYYKFHDLIEDIECYGNNKKTKGENISLLYRRNELDDAVYVGDIEGDYISSKEAGVKFIHAAYGFGKIDEPVPEIKTFAELINVADQVLG
ncbi:MAG: HAD family hydrolase [Lachnospiraceae bacterium]|nr:HAD family hydrolase [Lachnospiraceae bacterium]MDY4892498.1 HAD family hydrolase [Agathobacter sp.]